MFPKVARSCFAFPTGLTATTPCLLQLCTLSGYLVSKLPDHENTWRDQKIAGIVKKICLKYLYKFETLVPFEVLPLRLDAAIRAPLPMLETLSKILDFKLSP